MYSCAVFLKECIYDVCRAYVSPDTWNSLLQPLSVALVLGAIFLTVGWLQARRS
jgi:hypothetical protein